MGEPGTDGAETGTRWRWDRRGNKCARVGGLLGFRGGKQYWRGRESVIAGQARSYIGEEECRGLLKYSLTIYQRVALSNTIALLWCT